MYIDKDLLEKVEDITGCDFNAIATDEKDLFRVREINVLEMFEELCFKYKKLEEDYKDFQQNVEENYKQIPYWKQVL